MKLQIKDKNNNQIDTECTYYDTHHKVKDIHIECYDNIYYACPDGLDCEVLCGVCSCLIPQT